MLRYERGFRSRVQSRFMQSLVSVLNVVYKLCSYNVGKQRESQREALCRAILWSRQFLYTVPAACRGYSFGRTASATAGARLPDTSLRVLTTMDVPLVVVINSSSSLDSDFRCLLYRRSRTRRLSLNRRRQRNYFRSLLISG